MLGLTIFFSHTKGNRDKIEQIDAHIRTRWKWLIGRIEVRAEIHIRLELLKRSL